MACGRGFNSPRFHHNVKSQPLSGWDFFACSPSVGADSGHGARERHPWEVGIFTPAAASLFTVFSGGHASVLEATSFAGAGLEAVGCGWQLL